VDLPLLAVVAQVCAGGALLGAVYALTACGLNLVFGVMNVVNFAHGELMMLGAFVTYWLFAERLLGPVGSLAVSMPLLFLLGVLTQKYLLERLGRATEFGSLLLTFGLSLFLASGGLALWSANFRSVPYLSGAVKVAGLALPRSRLLAAVIALVITGVVFAFLRAHRFGKAIRATAQNSDSALACGIDVQQVRRVTFGLGAAMAGAAGSLISTMYAFNPEIGQVFVLKAFAIVILGGLGSFVGAFCGGLLLGVAEALAAFFTTAQLAEAVSYLIMILVLLVKPAGLLGFRE
jgi:branched-chain amino acid transport system permease protein